MINNEFLKKALEASQKESINGKVASYIPELSKADPNDLGICILDKEGNYNCIGDYKKSFTMQSVSKPFTLLMALMDNTEDEVFSKVGKEPTGDPFNSLVRLETYVLRKPLNPMINAGAITIASLIKGKNNDEKLQRLLNFIRKMANDESISFNNEVYLSEKATGNRNRALAYFLRDIGNIDENVEDILDFYFMQCSINVNAKNLSTMGLVIANNGYNPFTKEQIVPKAYAKIAKTLMVTCGMYDESGEYAMNVGIPSKSGVGGGIVCSVPHKYGIGVYGPSLNKKGNSVSGMKLLEIISKEYDLSIF